MMRWAQVRFPRETALDPEVLTRQLAIATGMQPQISPAVAVSRTLIEKTRLEVSWPMFVGMAGLGFVCMFIYSIKAGLWVAFALLHDFLICLLAMVVFRVRLDLATTAALAAMVGYSIYDSIVVLHRLRNLKREKEKPLHRELSFFVKEDRSVVQQLPAENLRRLPARVVLASSTTALPMIVLAFVGGGLFDSYAVIVAAGAVFGTLSSVYMVGRTQPWGFVDWGKPPE
jgi:preprotein translocase subunit SecF